MSLSLIIPVKNEEEIILNTINFLEKSWIKEIDHEIIFIDDFSNDKTWKLISNYKSTKLNILLFKNTKPGLGSAINTAFDNFRKDFFCIFMSDLSDDLDDLKSYYQTISDSNLDAVFGSRFIKGSKVKNYPKFKYILNRFANFIVGLFFMNSFNDYTNAFKIYRKDALKKLQPIVSENFNVFLELPLKIIGRKFKYKVIPISWHGRRKGISKFKINELGSKYLFTLLYCYLEKMLIRKRND